MAETGTIPVESPRGLNVRIVENNEQLAAFLAELTDVPYVTLDTEFLRDQTYYPKLCLIQMAAPAKGDTPGAEGIIDPLAPGLDLTPFYDFIKRPEIVKVLHAAPGRRAGGCPVRHAGCGDGLRLRRCRVL